jgi:hypothetical protein
MPLRTEKTWFGVVLGAPDARELAHFYERLLGWTIFNESDGWVDLSPSEDAGYNSSFATEKHYARPVWPTGDGKSEMSVHLDIEVEDLEQAVAYTVGVGAEEAAFRPQEAVRVMLDPAGHPLLLVRRLTPSSGCRRAPGTTAATDVGVALGNDLSGRDRREPGRTRGSGRRP